MRCRLAALVAQRRPAMAVALRPPAQRPGSERARVSGRAGDRAGGRVSGRAGGRFAGRPSRPGHDARAHGPCRRPARDRDRMPGRARPGATLTPLHRRGRRARAPLIGGGRPLRGRADHRDRVQRAARDARLSAPAPADRASAPGAAARGGRERRRHPQLEHELLRGLGQRRGRDRQRLGRGIRGPRRHGAGHEQPVSRQTSAVAITRRARISADLLLPRTPID